VNTLVVTPQGYFGHNTDYAGALDALTEALACERNDLAGTHVAVLGSGGAARAVVAGLTSCGCRVTIYSIEPTQAAPLGRTFDCAVASWEQRQDGGSPILVNCTSVGMAPDLDASPMSAEGLDRYETVFDIVYNPLETKLLREAKAAGCRTIRGVEMFINQAAAQYRLWTGKRPEPGLWRAMITRELTGSTGG
jgi:shikimate 5-dehydrogenase